MARIEDERKNEMWVVGIGASAGGLEALQSFVSHLAPTIPATFIVAQHLAPHAKSMLVELLSRHSKLPVTMATNGQKLREGLIYIVPPNSDVDLHDGKLYLHPPGKETRPKPSVNSFFESLARAWGSRAVGIILSGTGTDGSEGIRAIKSVGGLTFAQDDVSARYDGMPRSAVDTGEVDAVMPPEKLASELEDLLRNRMTTLATEDVGDGPHSAILKLIKHELGSDFSQYKTSTIHRRIDKHMRSLNLDSLESYLEVLKTNTLELNALSQELLISVTSFFRDREAFEGLESELERIIQDKRSSQDFRGWIAGCATGEEAYSVAILVFELCKKFGKSLPIKIFATDLDQEAILVARNGQYAATDVEHLDSKLLEKYFDKRGQIYEVKKMVREVVVFAKQNLIQSAPFVKVDLITCRNVMIYFEASLQKKIFDMFHYALSPGGVLFLGKSESVSDSSPLFEVIDRKSKLFRKLNVVSPITSHTYRSQVLSPAVSSLAKRTAFQGPSLLEAAMRETVTRHGLSGVVVDENYHILQVMGDVSDILKHPEGQPSLNLQNMLPKGIGHELPVVLRRVVNEGAPQKSRSYPLGSGKKQTFQFEVSALLGLEKTHSNKLYLVLFEVNKVKTYKPPVATASHLDEGAKILELEQELAATREHLQTVIEELGVSNEELQSLNEELQSTNEEMQSSNEELETTNEELQSTNEELTTLNEEMTNKAAELRSANLNLENIQNSIPSGMVVIDEDLKVRRYNNAAKRIFEISEADIGRDITRLSCKCDIPNFHQTLISTLDSGSTSEVIVENFQIVYQLRVIPSYDENQKVIGAILIFFDNTSLIQAEEQLRSSELRIRAIMDSSPSLIWLKDPVGKYLVANDAFCEFFGVSVDQVIGRTDFDLFHPDLANQMREGDLEILHKRIPIRKEERFSVGGALKDSDRFLMISRFPILGLKDDKNPQSVGNVAIDITTQCAMQLALAKKEARYRAIIEDQAVFVCRINPDGVITFVNTSFCNYFSGTYQYFVGRRFEDVIAAGDRDRVSRDVSRLSPQNPISQFEHRLGGTDIDGAEVKWLRWIYRALFDSEGELQEYQAVGFDVTSYRHETDRLQQRESLLTHVFEHTMDYLSVFRVEGEEFILESFNHTLEKAKGFAFPQLVGRSLKDLLRPENMAAVLARYQECVRTKKPQVFEEEIQVLNGEVRPLSTSLVPVTNSQGLVERVAAISRDISQFKIIECELRKEKERAEQANNSKTDFLASMSHELRTPLNVVLGMSQLLCDSSLSAEQNKFVKSIQRSGQILLSLIEDILDLAKIEEGKLKLEPIGFHLKDLVVEVIDSFALQSSKKNLLLNYRVDPSANQWLVGDPGRIRQILVNLLGNAVKFTDEGSVNLEILAKTSPGTQKTQFEFKIVDTGIGIKEIDYPRIFQKFSQVETGLSRRFGGTGLGLAICKRLVDLMGGEIGFHSSWGRGSTFWFILPLPLAEENKKTARLIPMPQNHEPRQVGQEPVASGPLKILAVDDNFDSQMVIQLFLKNLGHQAILASGGRDAIHKVSQDRFDLVLMDCQMPEIDGYETTSQIRKMGEAYADLPIIALTANAMTGDAEKCLRAGMSDYLSKPVNIEALRDVLAKWGCRGKAKVVTTAQNAALDFERDVDLEF